MRPYDIPNKYKRLFEKARTGRSRSAAVRAFCLMCTGFQEREVRLCPSVYCPLHKFRMGNVEAQPSAPEGQKNRQTATNTPEVDSEAIG